MGVVRNHHLFVRHKKPDEAVVAEALPPTPPPTLLSGVMSTLAVSL